MKTEQQIIDALGEWICKDMANELHRNRSHASPFGTSEMAAFKRIHDVGERIKFYRDNVLSPTTKPAGECMSKLPISKQGEADAVAAIWNMAASSLEPESYAALEAVLGQLCDTRHIDFETVGRFHKLLSLVDNHFSDCPSNNAPAMLPGPCSCAQRTQRTQRAQSEAPTPSASPTHTVTIDGEEFSIPAEVSRLIELISKERDALLQNRQA